MGRKSPPGDPEKVTKNANEIANEYPAFYIEQEGEKEISRAASLALANCMSCKRDILFRFDL